MINCNYDKQSLIDQRQKLIQNVVRVSSSEYSMNLASNIVYDSNSTNTNLGLADRTSNVGTHEQKIKKGVNVKHDSYARYLAKKKGKAVLKADNPTTTRPVAQNGGKNYKFAIINNCVRC
mgnify:FL=1|tara:strand:+ start:623 stop:982 length:360 start_codon:yes stop_codon:yes gene_type:complete